MIVQGDIAIIHIYRYKKLFHNTDSDSLIIVEINTYISAESINM